jgi:DNA-directed RNA polymerase subunit alpha
VPVENRDKEKLEIGTIAIDAVYTPVKNVNFRVEHVRVEQFTNYDKLILSITTDDTVSPEAALKTASEILVNHFEMIVKLPEEMKSAKEEVKKKEDKKEEKKEEKTEVSGEKKKRGRPKKIKD